MNIDWTVVRDNVKFLVALFKPSLAKTLSLPLLLTGIGILNSPLWLELVNWYLSKQEILPQFRGPISAPKDTVGWIFIAISVLIYLIDVFVQIQAMRMEGGKKLLNVVKDHPELTADSIVQKFRNTGFTAQHLQDEKIDKLTKEITLLRFFDSFPKEEKAIRLASSIIDGELSGGTPSVKARSLALLARYLCVGERSELAKTYLFESKKILKTSEGCIVEAFIDAIDSNEIDVASNLLEANSTLNYSAYFVIKKLVEGDQGALDWMESARLCANDFDADGKVALVSSLLASHQWEKALEVVELIDDNCLSKTPALAQLSAFTFLTNAIKAEELRESVMLNIPFAADKFPLADNAHSIELRNRSVEFFKTSSKLAGDLSFSDLVDISDEYALWLELRNPDTYETARSQLQYSFSNYTQKTLRFLPLAFAFGIEIDFESIEKEVNRQTALSSNSNPVLGIARFVLAQAKKTFPEVLEYIADHRVQLEKCLHPLVIKMLEIEALARSGLIGDAELLLNEIESSSVSASEVKNLRNVISSAKGDDPIALALAQYQGSKATSDLSHLVSLLEGGHLKEKYYSYSRELFDRTGQEFDAIRVCNAASSLGIYTDLHQFLLDIDDLVKRSEGLQIHWAWSLFRKGNLSGAREQVALLKKNNSQKLEIQTLEINLAIFSGDWEALSVFVEDKWNNRNRLDPDDLLQAVQLAKAVSPGRAKQILEFATNKYPTNPQVLASSYFAATTMGWEDNQEKSEWLNKAIALSDDDGPLHLASLEDIKEMMSDRREQNERTHKVYANAGAPIFTVAEMLNKTMSDFYLIQPMENKKATDIRRKNLVATFSGARVEQVVKGELVAIDASSALIMEILDVLRHLFDCFKKIVISHSFMRSLYEEKQNISFHQPSQIENAKYFERLVSDGRISVFHPKKINNPELAIDVGDELAYILEEANTSSVNESQVFVVCSYPVTKVGGTFREIEVDLTKYRSHLISCTQLIKKIKDLAVITEAQCVKALNYLRQHEKEWPNDLELPEGATLFLNSLSISYLITVDMLEKLSEAGFNLYVYKGKHERSKMLINYDLVISDAESRLENIRRLFFDGINSGKVILAEMPPTRGHSNTEENRLSQQLEEFFEALKICDAALVDDRFMNQHANFVVDEKSIPIFTTLDYLENLCHGGLISTEEKLDYRALLRESGFAFIPISSQELDYHINQSVLVAGEFKPSRQLRLLKENFSSLKISGLVQLPRDGQWLSETMKKFSRAIMDQWSADIAPELCRSRSEWIYDLMEFRGWAQSHDEKVDGGIAYFGEVLKISLILIVPESISPEKKEEYKAWLDEFVLTPLKNVDPYSYKHLIRSTNVLVKSSHDQSIPEVEGMDKPESLRAYLTSQLMSLFPKSIESELLSDTKLMNELGIMTDASITFDGDDLSFSRNVLFNTIRNAFYNAGKDHNIEDKAGNMWSVSMQPDRIPNLLLTKGDIKIDVSRFWPLDPEIDKRLHVFKNKAMKRRFTDSEIEQWNSVLSETMVGDDDVSDLLIDMENTPHHIERLLRQEFHEKKNNTSALVPNDIHYYERLIGKYHSSKDINEYCQNELKWYFNFRIRKDININEFLQCTHKSISKIVSENLVDETQYKTIAEYAIKTSHPILLIACLEVGVLRFIESSVSVVEELLVNLSSPKVLENLRLFCSMVVFVDGELARLQLFRGKPPFYRRLASFTQSALIVKVVLEEGIVFDKVEQWAAQQRGTYFYCQTFVDLREEPRWLPTYLTAEQFISELYGRVSIACQEADECEAVANLQKDLQSSSQLNLRSFLPGPLEGNSIPSVIPDDIKTLLSEHIKDEAALESYKVLINSAPFWKIDEEFLERAVSLLENAQHQLKAVHDKDSVYQVLNGLAQVSCMTRNKNLAKSVIVLSRIYRDYLDIDSNPENYLAMGIVAGAAFEDEEDWAEYIGQWSTELVYLPISVDSISEIRFMLERLCVLDPYLFHTCSKALEILRMLNNKYTVSSVTTLD